MVDLSSIKNLITQNISSLIEGVSNELGLSVSSSSASRIYKDCVEVCHKEIWFILSRFISINPKVFDDLGFSKQKLTQLTEKHIALSEILDNKQEIPIGEFLNLLKDAVFEYQKIAIDVISFIETQLVLIKLSEAEEYLSNL